jgi:hypothetical protein
MRISFPGRSLFPVVFLAGSALLLLFVGCGGSSLLCGPDTRLEDGACVRIAPPTSCGPGSALDETSGECRPELQCAPGTVYDAANGACVSEATCGEGTTLDPDTGLCLPDTSCGPGTTYNPEQGRCEPDSTCAAGTHIEDGFCVPDDACGEGAIYHPLTRLCVPEVRCGPGLIAHEGTCLSEAEVTASAADAQEGNPDDNDPLLGGSPELLILEPVGESAIFTGNIARPVDLDGDDEDDQDWDHWSFEGSAGQLIRIRILDAGLPNPGFRVVGPNGYLRTARLGVSLRPNREMVLPEDGTYTIEVAPLPAIRGDDLISGGADHGYVGVVEELPWPGARPMTAPQLPEADHATGTLYGSNDNFLSLAPQTDTGLLIAAQSPSLDTEPVLLLFDAAGRHLETVPFDSEDETFVAHHGTWAKTGEGLLVVVDWITSNGFDSSFDVGLSALPGADLGAVPADTSAEFSRTLIPGFYAAVFSHQASAGQIVTAHVDGITNPGLTLVGPEGTVGSQIKLSRELVSFVAQTDGLYHWVVTNTRRGDADVSMGIISATPGLSGAVSPQGPPLSLSGDLLQGGRRMADRASVLFAVDAPSQVKAAWSFDMGLPQVELWKVSETGLLEDKLGAGPDDLAESRLVAETGDQFLVLMDAVSLSPMNPPVRDWTLTIDARAPAAPGEAEPNDDIDSANTLGSDPVHIEGLMEVGDVDVYGFSVSPPLAAGEVLEVRVANLDSQSATALEIQDGSGTRIYKHSAARASGWTLVPQDGNGPFFIELDGTGTAEYRYTLELERTTRPVEMEPNDDFAGAEVHLFNPGSRLELLGSTRADDPDVFEINLAAPLSASEGLWVRVENLLEPDDLDVIVYDHTLTPLEETDHQDAMLVVRPSGTGPITVEVIGESTSRTDQYRLMVDVLSPVEVEPNDSPAEANPIAVGGTGETVVWGQDARGIPLDTFAVTVSEALNAQQHLALRWQASLSRGDMQIYVLDAAENEVAFYEDYGNTVLIPPELANTGFFVQVVADGFSSNTRPELYQLGAEVVSIPAEVEPNNIGGEANPIGLPAQIRGASDNDDPDVFLVTLPRDLAADERLHLDVRVLDRQADVEVTVRDQDGDAIFEGADVFLVAEILPTLTIQGSTYTFEVRSTHGSANEHSLYELRVSLDPP